MNPCKHLFFTVVLLGWTCATGENDTNSVQEKYAQVKRIEDFLNHSQKPEDETDVLNKYAQSQIDYNELLREEQKAEMELKQDNIWNDLEITFSPPLDRDILNNYAPENTYNTDLKLTDFSDSDKSTDTTWRYYLIILGIVIALKLVIFCCYGIRKHPNQVRRVGLIFISTSVDRTPIIQNAAEDAEAATADEDSTTRNYPTNKTYDLPPPYSELPTSPPSYEEARQHQPVPTHQINNANAPN